MLVLFTLCTLPHVPWLNLNTHDLVLFILVPVCTRAVRTFSDCAVRAGGGSNGGGAGRWYSRDLLVDGGSESWFSTFLFSS